MSTALALADGAEGVEAGIETTEFELYVRGEIPPCLEGSLVVATSRRHKDRSVFSRWHDSQADLLKLDLHAGRPGRVHARYLSVDPNWPARSDGEASGVYRTQPNHGLNCSGDTVWATNLILGAPLEIDLCSWRPRRVLRYLEPSDTRPQISSTSHFAWSLDGRYAYFHQSLLERETPNTPVRAADLSLFEFDSVTGSERAWRIEPPPEDGGLEQANFHSAFYYEEGGKRFVGLLRTGVVLEAIESHGLPTEHEVIPMTESTIWILELDERSTVLRASLLPGLDGYGGYALSHLDVDASSGDGFILYANYKQADVGEETHGRNLYGEDPDEVPEHYSGMIIEAFNFGQVLRYERKAGSTSVRTFKRAYVPGRTSRGHSWLPINIELDSSGTQLFCSFSGFRPRLLPRHVANAYEGLVADVTRIRYVPPLLMRFDADRLEPDVDPRRGHLSYAESIAFTLVEGDGDGDYVCTFAPEFGLRIYRAADLSSMVAHAVAAGLMTYGDTHFRPPPAHMQFVRA